VLLSQAHSRDTLSSQLHDVTLELVLLFFGLQFSFLSAEVELIVDADDVDGQFETGCFTVREVRFLLCLFG